MVKKKSKKGYFKTSNMIKSSMGTSTIRFSTKKHPLGAGIKKVIFRKKKRK